MEKPDVTIPESAYPAIQSLIGLSPSDFDAFIQALLKSEPAIDPNDFCKHISEYFPQLDFSVLTSIVNELFTLDAVRDNWSLSVADFSEHISDAALSQSSEEFPVNKESRDLLELRLSKIFDARKTLSLTAKALDIVTDQPHLFYSAKLLTDMRPVFDESGKSIDAMVMLHNLRIHYGDGDDHKDFVVTLDSRDIKKLRSILERADQKADTLKSFLKASQTTYLDVED